MIFFGGKDCLYFLWCDVGGKIVDGGLVKMRYIC